MLAGKAEADEALFFLIRRERDRDASVLCDLAEVRSLVETGSDVPGLVQKFSRIAARKA
jgi:hypothetical protein